MDNIMMDCAGILSMKSVLEGGGPFGCVIIDENNNIIGNGQNMVSINNDPTAHAEVVAVRDACRRKGTFNLSGCKIYTSCEPCPMCLGAIYWARLETIYYSNTRNDAKKIGFDDEFIYDEFNCPIEKRKIPMIHCPNEMAVQGFSDWSTKEDKTEY
jgi:tRNA(Arg) A34 adenosine deaminase TadA